MQASGWRSRCGSSSRHRCIGASRLMATARSIWPGRLVGEHAEVVHAGVVDQHVDAAAPRRGLGGEAPAVDGAGEVRGERADAFAVARQALGRAAQRRLVAVHEQHRGAAGQQFVGDGAADAAAAAGHQRTHAGRVHADFLCSAGRGRLQAAEHVAVQPVDAARAADHRAAILFVGEALEDRAEVVDVLLVELAVAAQVGERRSRAGPAPPGCGRRH